VDKMLSGWSEVSVTSSEDEGFLSLKLASAMSREKYAKSGDCRSSGETKEV
jgi:hypothetical protein